MVSRETQTEDFEPESAFLASMLGGANIPAWVGATPAEASRMRVLAGSVSRLLHARATGGPRSVLAAIAADQAARKGCIDPDLMHLILDLPCPACTGVTYYIVDGDAVTAVGVGPVPDGAVRVTHWCHTRTDEIWRDDVRRLMRSTDPALSRAARVVAGEILPESDDDMADCESAVEEALR